MYFLIMILIEKKRKEKKKPRAALAAATTVHSSLMYYSNWNVLIISENTSTSKVKAVNLPKEHHSLYWGGFLFVGLILRACGRELKSK